MRITLDGQKIRGTLLRPGKVQESIQAVRLFHLLGKQPGPPMRKRVSICLIVRQVVQYSRPYSSPSGTPDGHSFG